LLISFVMQADREVHLGFLRLSVQIAHQVLFATMTRVPTQRNGHFVYALLQRSDVLDKLSIVC